MKQEKLEEKVRKIFENQGFKVQRSEEGLKADNGEEVKQLQVFSSEKFELEEAIDAIEPDSIVFVDPGLSEVKEKVNNRVSVLEEKEEQTLETPSYELIGDIAVINEISDMEKDEAIEGIRSHHPRVKTVLLKKEPLSGEFRVGSYEKLYGQETETIHKEFGCRFKVDPTKVYYSERFSTERNRVVSQIEDGEKVLVMFAGVGPYAVMAARNADPEKVVSVEKNPEAVEYMRENVERNNVGETVEIHEGDVGDILPDLELKFDRAVMPLPGSADEYLEYAIEVTREGGMIHFYSFMEEGEWESLESQILEIFGEKGDKFSVTERTVCGDKGPGIKRVCLDIRVEGT